MRPEHHWTVLSRHATSEGTVVYESCHCGAHRVRQVIPGTRSVMEGRPVSGPSTAGSHDRRESTATVLARTGKSRAR